MKIPRLVFEHQRVPRFLSNESVAGACEFCPWVGAVHPRTTEGCWSADADSREHLASKHAEKVTYWEDSA